MHEICSLQAPDETGTKAPAYSPRANVIVKRFGGAVW